MKDDKAFIRQYAAEIAKSLREQEEGGPAGQPSLSVEESTQALYRALCFDEPLLDDIPHLATAASSLCRQLANPLSQLALSNRLVNGIIYLCRQRSSSSTTKTTTSTTTLTANDTEGSPTISVTLAKLAFCILVQVPLECCQCLMNEDISCLQKLLGSFHGNLYTDEHAAGVKADNSESLDTDQKVDQLARGLSSGVSLHEDADAAGSSSTSQAPEKQTATGPMEEVWAAESDPSDFDYGEGDGETSSYFAPLPNATEFVDLLDPMVLSKPKGSLSLEEACTSIASLLQQANFSILAPIFQLSQKQVEMFISQLTQLQLLILQPPKSVLCPDGEEPSSSLQNSILTPLWVLRDAALHYSSQINAPYTESYLEIIQTLLAVDQAYQSDASNANPLCSASIVGLSALSSWCCTAQISLPLTINATLDAMNDLAHVMERAMEGGYRDNLQYSISPIIELLTGISFQECKVGEAISGSNMVSQTLLNSGLLRQLLMISTDSAFKAPESPYYLDHALWGLCVTYPAVVGKYVARYPGFPSIVRRYLPSKQTSRDCVQSILWNSFAFTQCNDDSTPQIVWKTKSINGATAPKALTKEECQEVCQKSWAFLCEMVRGSMGKGDGSLSAKQSLDIVLDWGRLLKMIAILSVAPVFQSLMTDFDVQLSAIQGDLTLAKDASKTTRDSRNTCEKMEDEDEERKKASMTQQELILATARKTLKEYTLFFQGNTRGSSKTD